MLRRIHSQAGHLCQTLHCLLVLAEKTRHLLLQFDDLLLEELQLLQYHLQEPAVNGVELRAGGQRVTHDFDGTIPEMDVINMLRIQKERMTDSGFPSVREYTRFFGMNSERLKRCKPDVLIMHPGPVNRGVELSPEVADSPFSVILDQVANGVAVRMAVLYLLAGSKSA